MATTFPNITVNKETVRAMIAFENVHTWYLKAFNKIEAFLKNDPQTKTHIMLMHMVLKAEIAGGKSDAWEKVVEAIYTNVVKNMHADMERLMLLETILKQYQPIVFVGGNDYRYKPIYKMIDEVLESMLMDLLVKE